VMIYFCLYNRRQLVDNRALFGQIKNNKKLVSILLKI
jgi:hypothetical protein